MSITELGLFHFVKCMSVDDQAEYGRNGVCSTLFLESLLPGSECRSDQLAKTVKGRGLLYQYFNSGLSLQRVDLYISLETIHYYGDSSACVWC